MYYRRYHSYVFQKGPNLALKNAWFGGIANMYNTSSININMYGMIHVTHFNLYYKRECATPAEQ